MDAELKTQKELFAEHCKKFSDSKRALELKCDERKEAIKWGKMFNKDLIDQKKYRKKHLKTAVKGIYEQCLEEKVGWIKHFFNLTDKEFE